LKDALLQLLSDILFDLKYLLIVCNHFNLHHLKLFSAMKTKILFLILISFLSAGISLAQKSPKKIVITGYVLDVNQKPVADAMIFIDNVKTDVVTNEKGYYRIKIKSSAKTISAISFLNGLSEAPIEGKNIINLTMKVAGASSIKGVPEQSGDETVNVGYGSVKKKDLTTAVGNVNGEERDYASYKDIYEMIRGRVPGVLVTGTKIRIRGESSINASNEPLLVVDGIIVSSIDDIAPKDVKSIDILKGSAASIYGSRGSNGVILITLRSARDKE
jgi:TonB-dependent SusC/RagA subfamily outer membrane receptor